MYSELSEGGVCDIRIYKFFYDTMKRSTTQFLQKYPKLYDLIVGMYIYCAIKCRYLKEYFIGTRLSEEEWATRHLYKNKRECDDWGTSKNDWIKSYWDSLNHPHRKYLIDEISEFAPTSVLEIGSNCGPNLRLLAEKNPDTKITGIDINPMAVQKGNEWFKQNGISNVKLIEGKVDNLYQFEDNSFDVVFADAVLIYIGPDKIKKVMEEIIRVARNGLILVEWHDFEKQHEDSSGLGVYTDGYWKRNYINLLKQFFDEDQIHIAKINSEMWPDKNWSKFGGIIKVIIK